jgi:hypothetical protein
MYYFVGSGPFTSTNFVYSTSGQDEDTVCFVPSSHRSVGLQNRTQHFSELKSRDYSDIAYVWCRLWKCCYWRVKHVNHTLKLAVSYIIHIIWIFSSSSCFVLITCCVLHFATQMNVHICECNELSNVPLFSWVQGTAITQKCLYTYWPPSIASEKDEPAPIRCSWFHLPGV